MRNTLSLLFCAVTLGASAQLLLLNGSTMTVKGAPMTVKGDVLATSGASIANTGVISVSGDITNNSGSGLFTAVQGDVVMNGAAQVIGGTSATAFDDLDLQCTSLTLQQDIIAGGMYASPTGVLQLNNAIVQLNTQRITVTNAAPAGITRINGQLVSETLPVAGYGEVQWNIGANTGTYVVPFGTGTAYLPVSLAVNTAGTGAGSFLFATYPTNTSATPNNRPLPTGLSSLTDLGGNENAPNVLDRYWPITTANYSTAPTATLTFAYQDAEWNTGTNTITEGALQAQHFNGSIWSQPPMGLVNTSSNTLTTSATNAFDLVWALVQSSTPLPVELLFFTARNDGADVRCEWATATEQNNDFFTVERSADAVVFEDIGEVGGAGTSLSELHYAFLDHAPWRGLSYYRLRQTDFDGSERWSDAMPVWREAPQEEITLFPNPCTDVLNVLIGASPVKKVQVVDATGRLVMNAFDADGKGIDVSTLLPGAYSLLIDKGSAIQAARFIKR